MRDEVTTSHRRALAAALFCMPNADMRGAGMRSRGPPILKFMKDRCVCAPQYLEIGAESECMSSDSQMEIGAESECMSSDSQAQGVGMQQIILQKTP